MPQNRLARLRPPDYPLHAPPALFGTEIAQGVPFFPIATWASFRKTSSTRCWRMWSRPATRSGPWCAANSAPAAASAPPSRRAGPGRPSKPSVQSGQSQEREFADYFPTSSHNDPQKYSLNHRPGTSSSLSAPGPGSPRIWGPRRAIYARWGEGTGLRPWGGGVPLPVPFCTESCPPGLILPANPLTMR